MPRFYNIHYIITKNQIKLPGSKFRRVEQFEDLFIYSGLDAQVMAVKHKLVKSDFYVFGEFISILNPGQTMQELLENSPTVSNDFLDFLDSLMGVFLILKRSEENGVEVFTDCSAVYKCFYQKDNNGNIIALCSDPILVQMYFGAMRDKSTEAISYYSSEAFLKFPYRIGNLTSFQNVFQLLPNYSLNLSTNNIHRIFPRIGIERNSMEEIAERLRLYFDNITRQLVRTFSVRVALTAGWDSRMVLASTIALKEKVKYFTFKTPMLNDKHIDITVSKAIAKSLNLDYNLINCTQEIDQSQVNILHESFELLDPVQFEFILNGVAKFNDKKEVILEGTVSEVVKNYLEDVRIRSGEDLCRAMHFPVHSYTASYFDNKYSELKLLEHKYGYDLRDLAHWEQDITNFAAQKTFIKQSYANVVPIFNSRKLIIDILSTDRKYRDKQSHFFYNFFIDQYYPELGEFQVNPKLKIRVIRLMKKLGVYTTYRNIVNKL